MELRFSQLKIGTRFICKNGAFIKIKNGSDRYNGNAKSLHYTGTANILGMILCTIIDDDK